jgi:CHASE1-domain containing sensor protein
MHKLLRRVHLSVSVSALITLVVGLALTALLFASVRRVESNTHQAKFAQEANLRTAAVADGLAGTVEQLTMLNQVFRTVGVVSREQFARLAAPLLARHPGIQALSFQRIVPQSERAAYEAAVARRRPGFAITEFVDGQQRRAGRRDFYNVVDYIEPEAGNAAAIGLDTGVTVDQIERRAHARAPAAPCRPPVC